MDMGKRSCIKMGGLAGLLAGAVLSLSLGFGLSASAQEKPAENKLGKGDTVLKGDAKCTACHDDSDFPKPTMLGERPWVLSIGKTKHGTVADGRTPTCASCHGESEDHMKRKDPSIPRPAPDRTFKKTTPAVKQDEACTSCHKGGNHMFWAGSAHANRGVSCATCHNVHNKGHDKVRDKKTQTEVCFSCHKEQRAQMNRPSHHPVPEGKMACSDCHNPHGSTGPKQLKKDSVNETCYQCHTEKRGPFIHNHQPVTEDCSICHNAHGTTAANLLKQRLPLLCQNCHSSDSHRTQLMQQLSVRSTSTGALGAMARGCVNCHSNIHGGNSTQNSNTVGRFRR
jgi:DmsE family decaheme c-type cytochrome